MRRLLPPPRLPQQRTMPHHHPSHRRHPCSRTLARPRAARQLLQQQQSPHPSVCLQHLHLHWRCPCLRICITTTTMRASPFPERSALETSPHLAARRTLQRSHRMARRLTSSLLQSAPTLKRQRRDGPGPPGAMHAPFHATPPLAGFSLYRSAAPIAPNPAVSFHASTHPTTTTRQLTTTHCPRARRKVHGHARKCSGISPAPLPDACLQGCISGSCCTNCLGMCGVQRGKRVGLVDLSDAAATRHSG